MFFYEAMGECGIKNDKKNEVMQRLLEKINNLHEKEGK